MTTNEGLLAHDFCRNCGVAHPPQARFCPVCGHSAQADQGASQPVKAVSPTSVEQLSPVQRVLKGRYRVVKHIGSGGYGEVYKAEDTEFGDRLVAIKEMGTSGMSAEEIVEATEAFKHEAFLLARLTHPGLPSIFDYFNEDGHWFLVMSFVEGETLEDHIERTSRKRLSIAEVLQIGIQLCSVLGYLHTRQPPIIFRDLKPSNIMRTPDGQVYLIDFGIARLFKQGQTKDTVALGSPGFAAPEQYGKKQSSPQTDVYSLGATMHYLISGQDPSTTPFVFARLDVPEYLGLNELLLAMVDSDIRKRPASMIAVKQGLQHIARECPPGLYMKDAASRPAPKSGKSPEVRGVVARPAPRPRAPISVDEVMDRRRMLRPPSHRPPQHQLQVSAPQIAAHALRPGEKLEVYYPLPKKPVSRRALLIGGSAVAVGSFAICGLLAGLMQTSSANVSTSEAKPPPTPPARPIDNFKDGSFAVKWSPDGRFYAQAVGNESGMVSIYNKQDVWQSDLKGHTGRVSALAWSPDGKRLASGSYDTTVRVWDVESQQSHFLYKDHSSRVTALAWSSNGTWIASSDEDGPVQVWRGALDDYYDGGDWSDQTGRGGALSLEFSPDNKSLAIAYGGDSALPITTEPTDSAAIENVVSVGGRAMSWSPDGRSLAYAEGAKVYVGSFSNNRWQEQRTFLTHKEQVTTFAWSPDGTRIASAAWDHTIMVWDTRDMRVLQSFLLDKNQVALSLSWSSQDQLISSDSEGKVRSWPLE
ncbi:protein kinase domain-containing protein [Ktedonospora formicarum]|uniref:non-specific serine/threonine protein kinase n=1 Tax=Ktedonospora formicarum TaxID=2778364 RepID=A0A8J3MQG1_9CHLR|nr:protein kinase [Ktedonospora formicarum]GHO44877.1 hypothetical protein KSX_30400 [Ktedonospora formicarum]